MTVDGWIPFWTEKATYDLVKVLMVSLRYYDNDLVKVLMILLRKYMCKCLCAESRLSDYAVHNFCHRLTFYFNLRSEVNPNANSCLVYIYGHNSQ